MLVVGGELEQRTLKGPFQLKQYYDLWFDHTLGPFPQLAQSLQPTRSLAKGGPQVTAIDLPFTKSAEVGAEALQNSGIWALGHQSQQL